jgi:ribosome-binding protein aMBF1 (putative translation factor)
MSGFQAVYYRAPDGSEPVSDFIDPTLTRFTDIGKLLRMAQRNGPMGKTAAEGARARAARSAAYRREQRRVAGFEGLARLVISHRARLGLSQKELAERVGTSHSAISRIESGQHRTSVATLKRLADALDVRLVVGFESGSAEHPERELVTV